jgi:hypothetical protein
MHRLMGGVYEFHSLDGKMWHNIHVHINFHKDCFRHSTFDKKHNTLISYALFFNEDSRLINNIRDFTHWMKSLHVLNLANDLQLFNNIYVIQMTNSSRSNLDDK